MSDKHKDFILFETDKKIGEKILALTDQLKKTQNYIHDIWQTAASEDLHVDLYERIDQLLNYFVDLSTKATLGYVHGRGANEELDKFLEGRSINEIGNYIIQVIQELENGDPSSITIVAQSLDQWVTEANFPTIKQNEVKDIVTQMRNKYIKQPDSNGQGPKRKLRLNDDLINIKLPKHQFTQQKKKEDPNKGKEDPSKGKEEHYEGEEEHYEGEEEHYEGEEEHYEGEEERNEGGEEHYEGEEEHYEGEEEHYKKKGDPYKKGQQYTFDHEIYQDTKLIQQIKRLRQQLQTVVNTTKYLPDSLERLYNQMPRKNGYQKLSEFNSGVEINDELQRYVFGNHIYKHTTKGQGSESKNYQRPQQQPSQYRSMQQTIFEQHGDQDVQIQQPIMNLLNNLVGNLD